MHEGGGGCEKKYLSLPSLLLLVCLSVRPSGQDFPKHEQDVSSILPCGMIAICNLPAVFKTRVQGVKVDLPVGVCLGSTYSSVGRACACVVRLYMEGADAARRKSAARVGMHPEGRASERASPTSFVAFGGRATRICLRPSVRRPQLFCHSVSMTTSPLV